MGSLMPRETDAAKYAQLYVCGGSAELEARMRLNQNLNAQLMQDLQTMLHSVNPYVQMYETARERLRDDAAENYHISWFTDIGGIHRRQYNAPQVTEVGVIATGADEEGTGNRDIIVQPKQGPPKRISEFSSCYDPMHYVLLYPHGTNGWSVALKKAARSSGERTEGLTIMQYYRYMLGVRPGVEPLRPYAWGYLCHQFVADMYCKVDSDRLLYIRLNQRQIRAEVYQS